RGLLANPSATTVGLDAGNRPASVQGGVLRFVLGAHSSHRQALKENRHVIYPARILSRSNANWRGGFANCTRKAWKRSHGDQMSALPSSASIIFITSVPMALSPLPWSWSSFVVAARRKNGWL